MCVEKLFKTTNGQSIDIVELNWGQICNRINLLNPKLAAIIDEISPSNEYKLYLAKYRFGAEIIKKEEAFLPLSNGESISFNNPDLPTQLLTDLSYKNTTSSPLGMILDKSCEFYLPMGNRVIPYNIAKPGDMLGLARVLDNVIYSENNNSNYSPSFMWDMVSGAKSTFLLAKISDTNGHAKLKKQYNVSAEKPMSYSEHFKIFREIAITETKPWLSEILFFSKSWIDKLSDPAWAKLYAHLLKSHRSSHKIWHNLPRWNAVFAEIEQKQHLNNFSHYTLATAKHLFTIAANSSIAFKPAIDDTKMPLNLLQDVYTNCYGLNETSPIIMEPTLFEDKQCVYYSLNYPTLTECNPEGFKLRSIIHQLDELQFIISKYKIGINSNNNNMVESLYNMVSNMEFDYYHNTPNDYAKIKPVTLIPDEDTRFKDTKELKFPQNSQFFKGAVKLSKRKTDT